MLIRFDTIHGRDGQRDRWTDTQHRMTAIMLRLLLASAPKTSSMLWLLFMADCSISHIAKGTTKNTTTSSAIAKSRAMLRVCQ